MSKPSPAEWLHNLVNYIQAYLRPRYSYTYVELEKLNAEQRFRVAEKIFVENVPIVRKATWEEQNRRDFVPVGVMYNLYRIQAWELRRSIDIVNRFKKELVDTKKELSVLKRRK